MAKTTNGMGRGPAKPEGTNVNGTNRETMGTSVYDARPDIPSRDAFMAGALREKEGSGKGSVLDPTSARGRTTVDSLGAKYGIQITHKPGYVENATTLANGRIVPSVVNRSQAFRAQ